MQFNQILPKINYHSLDANKLLPLILVKYDFRHLIITNNDKESKSLLSDLSKQEIKSICVISEDNLKEREGKSNMFSQDTSYKVLITNSNIEINYLKEVDNLHCLNYSGIKFLDKINKIRLNNEEINVYTYFDKKDQDENENDEEEKYDFLVGFVHPKGFCVFEG